MVFSGTIPKSGERPGEVEYPSGRGRTHRKQQTDCDKGTPKTGFDGSEKSPPTAVTTPQRVARTAPAPPGAARSPYVTIRIPT